MTRPTVDVTEFADRTAAGVEVDFLCATGSWSVRIASCQSGLTSLIVVDHATGQPVVAELLATA